MLTTNPTNIGKTLRIPLKDKEGKSKPKRQQVNEAVVVEGNSAFALDLYRELSSAEGNLFFAPYSISTALAMTYAGARENTAKQMAKVLHFTLDQQELHVAFAWVQAKLNALQEEGAIRLNVANSLWPQESYPFLVEYLTLVKKHYGVSITPLDYVSNANAARKIINQWVEKKTKNKIRDMIPPGVLDELTRLVLVNAVYFKGNWATRFNRDRTRDQNFYLMSGDTIRVPMMTQKRMFKYAEFDSLQVLELPYDGENLSMIVLLPREKDGLPGLEKLLTTGNLREWTASPGKQKVLVFLPKFKITSGVRLNKTLKSMGMTDAFMDKANFSGMDGNPNWLYIGAVLHKAFVEVNEEGTEAAATTVVEIKIRAIMEAPPPPTFCADHPFLFLIRENQTGGILFIGRVVVPAEAPGTPG
ncbi:MAG: serpin family protein [Candidatus Aminicenantes bacterium]|nr:MAG: serpin family protein [Candidatus Aminicenantes bacterium]